MNCFNGVPVYVSQDTPRMQLSARVCEVLTPAMVEDHNRWLLNFFGTTNLLKDGEVISVGDPVSALHMNPRTHEQLKAAVQAKRLEESFRASPFGRNYRW